MSARPLEERRQRWEESRRWLAFDPGPGLGSWSRRDEGSRITAVALSAEPVSGRRLG